MSEILTGAAYTESLERKVAFLTELLGQRLNEPRILHCMAALSVLGIKLNAMSWGEYSELLLDDLELVAKASIALDHLLEEREQVLVYLEVFKAWEAEMQQRTARTATAKSMATPLLDRWRECVLEDRRQTPLARGAAWEYAALKCTLDGDTNGAAVACERAEAAVTPRKRSSAA